MYFMTARLDQVANHADGIQSGCFVSLKNHRGFSVPNAVRVFTFPLVVTPSLPRIDVEFGIEECGVDAC